MARKITTTTNWAEEVESDEVVIDEPVIVSSSDPNFVKARVKVITISTVGVLL